MIQTQTQNQTNNQKQINIKHEVLQQLNNASVDSKQQNMYEFVEQIIKKVEQTLHTQQNIKVTNQQQYLCCYIQKNQQIKELFTFIKVKENKINENNKYDVAQQSQQNASNISSKQDIIQLIQVLTPLKSQGLNKQQNQLNQKIKINAKIQKNLQTKQKLSSEYNKNYKQIIKNASKYKLENFPQIKVTQQDVVDLHKQYVKNVSKVLVSKIPAQLQCQDYINITKEDYNRILTIWEQLEQKNTVKSIVSSNACKSNNIKNQNVGLYDKFLKLGDLSRLRPGGWLNDIIISAYIKLMNQAMQNKNGKYYNSCAKFIIFDSLKTQSVFNRQDLNQISRMLSKNNVKMGQTVLVMVINWKKHWYYLMVDSNIQKKCKNSKYKIKATIFDSIYSKLDDYLNQKLIKNMRNFYYQQYNAELVFKICQNYPQQLNAYDCGAIVLCGIKDTVRNYLAWSFDQNDINFKRAMITKQLVDSYIFGF